jgi:hypothetical protein
MLWDVMNLIGRLALIGQVDLVSNPSNAVRTHTFYNNRMTASVGSWHSQTIIHSKLAIPCELRGVPEFIYWDWLH